MRCNDNVLLTACAIYCPFPILLYVKLCISTSSAFNKDELRSCGTNCFLSTTVKLLFNSVHNYTIIFTQALTVHSLVNISACSGEMLLCFLNSSWINRRPSVENSPGNLSCSLSNLLYNSNTPLLAMINSTPEEAHLDVCLRHRWCSTYVIIIIQNARAQVLCALYYITRSQPSSRFDTRTNFNKISVKMVARKLFSVVIAWTVLLTLVDETTSKLQRPK